MEQMIRKSSVGAMVLALLMMLFGCVMFLMGCAAFRELRSEQATLIATGIFFLFAGAATIVSGVWLIGTLGRARMPLQIGGTAILTSGTVLLLAAGLGVLQCSGPG